MKSLVNNCPNCGSCPINGGCARAKQDVLPIQQKELPKSIKVALAGNPNSGKTTLFNAITGAHQKVGNYTGVTVDKKEGLRNFEGVDLIFYDLPGIYSLTAYSIDEVIARDFILNEKPDIIVNVIDATNIERNLFLCLQFQELGVPIIGVLNLIDEAEGLGIVIDEKELSKILGIPFVKTSAKKNIGIENLLHRIITCVSHGMNVNRSISYGPEVEAEIEVLSSLISKDKDFSKRYSSRWMAIKLLEKDASAKEKIEQSSLSVAVRDTADQCIKRIETHFGRDCEIVMSEQRYAYVHGAVQETVRRRSGESYRLTQLADGLLLNRIIGLPLFFGIMWAMFQLTFLLGHYPMEWLQTLFGWMSQAITHNIHNDLLQSMLVNGVIGGVGGVLSFVPLIIILFTCISFLEDTGYMARAAFLADKFLHIFGLHGQSFVPMVIGFGCSVPAMMSARTLKNERDRIITILITPFMSCGAKLPVYVLLAGAFFPKNPGNVIMLIYVVGIILALVSSILFRKTVLSGDATPFVMELPPYRMPTVRGILWHVWDKTYRYLKKAGTILLAASILIWVAVTFPRLPENTETYKAVTQEYSSLHPGATADQIKTYVLALKNHDALVNSAAGRIGKFFEPIVKPIGFDWKIGISVITGMAAKEAVVSTLGVLYTTGNSGENEISSLKNALTNDPAFNKLVAIVLMLMTLIAPPCIAALSTMQAEAGWQWLSFSVVYRIGLAWLICFMVYHIGSILIL